MICKPFVSLALGEMKLNVFYCFKISWRSNFGWGVFRRRFVSRFVSYALGVFVWLGKKRVEEEEVF